MRKISIVACDRGSWRFNDETNAEVQQLLSSLRFRFLSLFFSPNTFSIDIAVSVESLCATVLAQHSRVLTTDADNAWLCMRFRIIMGIHWGYRIHCPATWPLPDYRVVDIEISDQTSRFYRVFECLLRVLTCHGGCKFATNRSEKNVPPGARMHCYCLLKPASAHWLTRIFTVVDCKHRVCEECTRIHKNATTRVSVRTNGIAESW